MLAQPNLYYLKVGRDPYQGLIAMVNYRELRKLLYCLQAAMGCLFLVLAWHLLCEARVAVDALSLIVSGAILSIVGSACIVFGLDTYLLRDDPDIWR